MRVCLFVPARTSDYSPKYARMNDLITGLSDDGAIEFDLVVSERLSPGKPFLLRAPLIWRAIVRAARHSDIVHFVAVGWMIMPAFLWVRFVLRRPVVAGPNLYFLQFFTGRFHPDGEELLHPAAERALARDTVHRRPMKDSPLARRMERLRWRLLQTAHRVLALGSYCREVGVVHGARRDDIHILPLTAPLGPGEPLPAPLQAAVQAADERPIILYMGALTRLKGFDQFADMVDRIVPGRAHFLIAGKGGLQDRAEALAAARADVSYVGFLDRRVLLSLLPRLALYVQPSIWDLISTTLLEALRAGVPVISADIGSAQELRRATPESDAVRLYPVGDVDRLTALVEDTLTDPAIHKQAAEAVAETFDMAHAEAWLESLYEAAAVAGRRAETGRKAG